MGLKSRVNKKLFVLDTNVLMHDPAALFCFEEHDIFIPTVVLEELDRGKKGLSEVACNVRQISRFLDELMPDANAEDISDGLLLVNALVRNDDSDAGHLFFQTQLHACHLRVVDDVLGPEGGLGSPAVDHDVTVLSGEVGDDGRWVAGASLGQQSLTGERHGAQHHLRRARTSPRSGPGCAGRPPPSRGFGLHL